MPNTLLKTTSQIGSPRTLTYEVTMSGAGTENITLPPAKIGETNLQLVGLNIITNSGHTLRVNIGGVYVTELSGTLVGDGLTPDATKAVPYNNALQVVVSGGGGNLKLHLSVAYTI